MLNEASSNEFLGEAMGCMVSCDSVSLISSCHHECYVKKKIIIVQGIEKNRGVHVSGKYI